MCFVLGEDRRHFDQALTDHLARLVGGLGVLSSASMWEKFHAPCPESSWRALARMTGSAGHQLRMREALIDVLVDDVRLVQDEVALDQHRHAVVGIDDGNVFRLVEQVDVDHLEIHALFRNRTMRQRWLNGQVVPGRGSSRWVTLKNESASHRCGRFRAGDAVI